MIFFRLLAFLAVIGVTNAARAQVLWLKVEGPQRSFIVEMPAAPEYKITQQRSGSGTAYDYHSYALNRGPIDYVVQTAIYPADVDTSKPQALLQFLLDATARNLAGAKWQQVGWMTVQGATAAEATGALPDGKSLRQILALKDHHIFILGVSGPAGTVKFPDADRFLKSLKLFS